MSQLMVCVFQVRQASWAASLNDAGLNILGIPWWVWLIGAAILVGIAIAAATGLLEFGAPALLEGLELDTEALIAEEEDAAAARLEQEIASKVNPLYDPAQGSGTKNCSWVAREVDEALGDMFAGRTPDPWAPEWFTSSMADGATEEIEADEAVSDTIRRVGPRTPELADMARASSLADEYGGTFARSSAQQIAEQLEAAGNGSRGIVAMTNPAGGPGHVFNAVNYGGQVFFVDGQTGSVLAADALPAGLVNNPNVFFLPTSGF